MVLHIADTEDYAYTPHNPGITRVCQDGDYVGVLSVYEGHKKSGWAPLQDRIRKSTGWKIGILDIDKMVEQYRFWKIHNL